MKTIKLAAVAVVAMFLYYSWIINLDRTTEIKEEKELYFAIQSQRPIALTSLSISSGFDRDQKQYTEAGENFQNHCRDMKVLRVSLNSVDLLSVVWLCEDHPDFPILFSKRLSDKVVPYYDNERRASIFPVTLQNVRFRAP